jgi:hypothetical protein
MEIDDAERDRRAAKRAAKLAARRAAKAREDADRESVVRLLALMPDDDHVVACLITEALGDSLHYAGDAGSQSGRDRVHAASGSQLDDA